uniref:Uncharacterized protein n=1 Tax=Timema cristinae TaxID=61476 RepID=A0A7R9H8U4_TIMCR|nr:unnamed protein product [Timema cristinae]
MDLDPNRLLKDELQYEVNIRGEAPLDTVDGLHSQLLQLLDKERDINSSIVEASLIPPLSEEVPIVELRVRSLKEQDKEPARTGNEEVLPRRLKEASLVLNDTSTDIKETPNNKITDPIQTESQNFVKSRLLTVLSIDIAIFPSEPKEPATANNLKNTKKSKLKIRGGTPIDKSFKHAKGTTRVPYTTDKTSRATTLDKKHFHRLCTAYQYTNTRDLVSNKGQENNNRAQSSIKITIPLNTYNIRRSLLCGEVTQAPQPSFSTPCILIFDSMPSSKRTKVVATLREYLQVEYKAKYNLEKKFTRETMKGSTPRVPMQDNLTDYSLQHSEIAYSIASLGFTFIILSTILPLIQATPTSQLIIHFFNTPHVASCWSTDTYTSKFMSPQPIVDFHLPITNLENMFSLEAAKSKRCEIQQIIVKILHKTKANIEDLNLPLYYPLQMDTEKPVVDFHLPITTLENMFSLEAAKSKRSEIQQIIVKILLETKANIDDLNLPLYYPLQMDTEN